MSLLDETKAALAQAKAELEARDAQIRAPLVREEQRVAGLKAELEAARKQINDVKLQANGVTSRGPFLTRTASILRVGIAVVLSAFAGHIFTPYGWGRDWLLGRWTAKRLLQTVIWETSHTTGPLDLHQGGQQCRRRAAGGFPTAAGAWAVQHFAEPFAGAGDGGGRGQTQLAHRLRHRKDRAARRGVY